MLIFPAIDLYSGKAVRLYKGDYEKMHVYDDNPLAVARRFRASGATHMHMVDLEGARDGGTPNLESIKRIVAQAGLFIQLGGGIRSFETIEKYLSAGIDRVVLGTAAATEPGFAKQAVRLFGDAIAAGADIKDGYVAVKGWRELSSYTLEAFFEDMYAAGVKTVVCTDIAKDGAMEGTNLALYRKLKEIYQVDIVASGGVSSLADIEALAQMGLYGAVVGKAYYTGAIDLAQAIGIGGAA